MKLKITALFLLIAFAAFGQQIAPTPVQLYGQNAPDPGRCADPVSVASTYTQIENPANGYTGQYLCLPSNSNSFAWYAVALLPPGTTGTTGTVLISSGKTLTALNSLRLAGTDNAATNYLPSLTGGLPVLTFCGATSGNAACANAATGVTARMIAGLATLSSNSAVISNIPSFTSTSTYSCTSNDTTTVGNPTKVVNTSASSITITNTTGASDVVAYSCIGY